MKKIGIIGILLLSAIGVFAQHETKFKEENHKGQIFAIERNEYIAANKFGEDTKGSLISRSVAYFDMTGNPIKEIRQHSSQNEYLDTIFTYNNEMGRVSVIVQLQAKERWMETGRGSLKYYVYDTVMVEVYSYNANGKIADISTYKKKEYWGTAKMELAGKVKYEYSANSYTEKKYNENGDLKETSTYTNNGKKKVTKEQFGTVTQIYDNDYRLINETVQTSIYDMKEISKYTYNPQGDVITKQSTFTSRNKNGGHTDNWGYTYDNNKNWTVCKYYSNNNNAKEKRIETWTERNFTYIENFEQWQRLIDSIQAEDLSAMSYNKAKMQADSIKRADSLTKAEQRKEQLRKEEMRKQEEERRFQEAQQRRLEQQQEEERKLLSIAANTTKKFQIKQCRDKGGEIIFPYTTTSGDYVMFFDKNNVVKKTKDDAEYYISYDRTVFVCKIKDGKKYRYRIVYNGHPKYSIAKDDTYDLSEKCWKQFEEFMNSNE